MLTHSAAEIRLSRVAQLERLYRASTPIRASSPVGWGVTAVLSWGEVGWYLYSHKDEIYDTWDWYTRRRNINNIKISNNPDYSSYFDPKVNGKGIIRVIPVGPPDEDCSNAYDVIECECNKEYFKYHRKEDYNTFMEECTQKKKKEGGCKIQFNG